MNKAEKAECEKKELLKRISAIFDTSYDVSYGPEGSEQFFSESIAEDAILKLIDEVRLKTTIDVAQRSSKYSNSWKGIKDRAERDLKKLKK